MTRPADMIKAVRSYVVQRDSISRQLVVKESHWMAGYSEGHRETPEEAISHAITHRQAEIVRLNDEIHELELLVMEE